ncbi:hypothetical protein ACIBL5_05990 [Streptomyces sp. NPDC050516]|uniref:hypothetical protein n=1 Tax=Streptomyces sp. NPDC050516 TaxID=3365621 RepID=UPI0037A3E9FF
MSSTEEEPGNFTVKLTEAQRLDHARRGEFGSRPAAAEIYTSPYLGGTVLRLLSKEHRVASHRDVIRLSIEMCPVHGAMTDGVLDAASKVLALRGFNYAPGAKWAPYARTGTPHPTRPDTTRVAIVPTDAYLAYVQRRFGPEPEFTAPDGMAFKRAHRGMWTRINSRGGMLRLTWSPALDGDIWRLWDETDAPRIAGRGRGANGFQKAFAEYLAANGQ